MAVLVEAISVIVKQSSIELRFPGGMKNFLEQVPNSTYCNDGKLVRVGFMTPQDVKDFIGNLEVCGLVYLQNGRPLDLVVIDEVRGPTVDCDWKKVSRVQVEDGSIVVARMSDDERPVEVALPTGWKLSERLTFVHPEELGKRFVPISDDSGLSTFIDTKTGKRMYSGSPTQETRDRELKQIEALVQRALELDARGEIAKQSRDLKAGEAVYEELVNELLPSAQKAILVAQFYPGLAHYACGVVQRILGLRGDAVEQFYTALSYVPDFLYALLEITRCLGELGRANEAKGYAQNAVEIAPSSPNAWGNLSMVFIQLGEEEAARNSIEKALSLEPGNEVNARIKAIFERTFGSNG